MLPRLTACIVSGLIWGKEGKELWSGKEELPALCLAAVTAQPANPQLPVGSTVSEVFLHIEPKVAMPAEVAQVCVLVNQVSPRSSC